MTAASLETSCSQSCDWLGHNIGDEGVLTVSRLTKVSFKTGPSHNFDTASLVTVSILRLLTTDPPTSLLFPKEIDDGHKTVRPKQL